MADNKLLTEIEGILRAFSSNEQLIYCGDEDQDINSESISKETLTKVREAVEGAGLTFNEKEIVGLIPAQAIIDYGRAKEVIEKVAEAQVKAILKALGGE